MSVKTKSLIFISAICTLMLIGCGSYSIAKRSETQQLKEIKKTPVEKEKAQLLKEVDRHYSDANAHYELGKLYQSEGLWAQAEREYQTTLNFDPVHRAAQAGVVKVLESAGDKDKSVMLADIYMDQASASALGSLQLAMGFQAQQMDEYALRAYQQAMRLAPNSARVNRQIGYYYLSKGDRQLAQTYLLRSFQLDPSQPEVAGELGKMGMAVQIPRKQKKGKALDKAVDKADEERRERLK